MKKFLIIIVAVLYLFTSTGATLHLHYCMGELTQWNLSDQESSVCPGCGMDKKESEKKGCCKDEARFLKSSIDQKTMESAFQIFALSGIVLVPHDIVLPSIHIATIAEDLPVGNAPPDQPGHAVYILNSAFLI